MLGDRTLVERLEATVREEVAAADVFVRLLAHDCLANLPPLAFFRDLVAKFPESRYAADARARMRFLVNALASGEVHVARYYYNRGAYVAAASRAQQAVLTYPNAPAVEDALWLMVASYDRMNLPELRDDAKRVMEKNFPQSRYLTGDTGRAWWKIW